MPATKSESFLITNLREDTSKGFNIQHINLINQYVLLSSQYLLHSVQALRKTVFSCRRNHAQK